MDYKLKAIEIREKALKMITIAQSGHSGGSLSCVEIMIALYYKVMKIDPRNPRWEDRDRFVMSKGHCCPTLYAILADLGFFPEEDLWTLRRADSYLQGHPDMHKIPGIDESSGSLGQGMSVAMGMALAGKIKKKDYKVYTLIGDGESQEGIIWEAAEAASQYKLDNFTVLMDHNGLQIDGTNDEVMSIRDIVKKFDAFGFRCFSVDGHNVDDITNALLAPTDGRPKFIDCRTIKGKGVSFIENQVSWHGKAPTKEQYELALAELEALKNG